MMLMSVSMRMSKRAKMETSRTAQMAMVFHTLDGLESAWSVSIFPILYIVVPICTQARDWMVNRMILTVEVCGW